MDFLIILSLFMTAPAFPIYESSDFGRMSAITFIKSVSQADPISSFSGDDDCSPRCSKDPVDRHLNPWCAEPL